MTNIIALEGIRKEFKLGTSTIAALRGIDLELEKGRYYSIMGPSGSGKSTLLHILGCMDTPTKGKVWLNGRHVHTFDQRQRTRIRAQEIGFVFQAFHLNPILNAIDNVAITLRFMGETRRSARKKAEYWLQRVGLGARSSHHPSALSGGERQRVAIARAIAKNPSIILADEPTGNLDSNTGMDIVGILRDINQKEGTTIIQVTHDREVAKKSDTIYTLRDGLIIDGTH